MADLLIATYIANGGGNTIVVSTSSDAANWCYNNIPQSSKASSVLAVLNGDLWTAFRGNDSTKIYAAGLSDWGANHFTSQSSQVAPAAAAFIGKLWIAYIGETSGQVEVISSADGASWSAKSLTGQSSKVSPAIAAIQGTLWIAYIGESSGQVEVISSTDGTHWSAKTLTGQSSSLSPSLAAGSDSLLIAYIGQSSGQVEVITSTDGTNWSGKTLTGQSSKLSPALVAFLNTFQIAYIGEGSGNLEIISSPDGTHWSSDYDTGQGSQMAPALAVMAAEAPPNNLGGAGQYVFAGPVESSDPSVPLTPLLDLVVEIQITQPLVVSPTSGFKKGVTVAQPISFQINGFSQKGDSTICWQQYGISMAPGSNLLNSFAENWPLNPKAPNVFNLNSSSTLTLPNNLTLPSGLTFRLVFQYQGNTISGFNCAVTNSSTGANVGNLNMALVGLPLAAGGTIGTNDLAEIVAFQVVLVAGRAVQMPS